MRLTLALLIWVAPATFVLRGADAPRGHRSEPISAPYPPSPVIADIQLDWSTHRREAQGSDNFQLTWAGNDHQYGAWGDGGGFGGTNSDGRAGLGFARIEGDSDSWRGFNVWGGKNAENPAQFDGKSWGTICIDGVLYSWIVPDLPEGGGREITTATSRWRDRPTMPRPGRRRTGSGRSRTI